MKQNSSQHFITALCIFNFTAKLIINRLFKLKVGTKIIRLQTASDEPKTHNEITNNSWLWYFW